jgi:hypothetical protein
MTSFRTPTRFSFFEQIFLFLFPYRRYDIAECANIAEFANKAEIFWQYPLYTVARYCSSVIFQRNGLRIIKAKYKGSNDEQIQKKSHFSYKIGYKLL